MSEFFEAFNPSARHWREQQQLDKTLVVDVTKAGSGPRPLDLESGIVHLVMPRRPGRTATPDAPTPDAPDAGEN